MKTKEQIQLMIDTLISVLGEDEYGVRIVNSMKDDKTLLPAEFHINAVYQDFMHSLQ